MKKITLFLFLTFFALLLQGQQQQYLLDFEPGDPDALQATWATFENPSPGLDIIVNPDPDGVNTDASSQVMRLTLDQNSACYSGAVNFHSTLGTWQLDGAVSSNLTLSMDVNKSIIGGNVGIKFANSTDGTLFEITDAQGAVTTANEWQTLTWDISVGASSPENTTVDQAVIFIDWTCGNTPETHAENITLLVDNITWGANKLSDPPAATCDDGLQNGDETGIDCGGSSCADCPPVPVLAAPSPTIDESNVLSVYSDSYPTNTVTNFNLNAFQGTGTISQIDIESNNNNAIKIDNLSFYGAQWDAVDVSSFVYVNLDYYVQSSSVFNFYLIDATAGIPGGNAAEPRYSFTSGGDAELVVGEWTSVSIPLQHFLDYDSGTFTYDLNDIFQYKFDGNGTIYVDNIYFTTETLSTSNFDLSSVKIFPNPSGDDWKIESVNTIKQVQLYDVLGKRVMSLSPNSTNASINSEKLNKGIYFADITTDLGSTTKKLIKN